MDTNEIKKEIEIILNANGYDLYSMAFKKVNKEYRLEIVVDRVEPIDLNAIYDVSEKISTYLDETDPIEEKYTLDISSLGVEKPIAINKLPAYIGKKINVHLINPVDGENIIEGTLISTDENETKIQIKIKARVKEVAFATTNISKVRLAL